MPTRPTPAARSARFSVRDLARTPGLVVADPGGGSPADLPVPQDGVWTVAVGPEGGFTDDEVAVLGDVPRSSRSVRTCSGAEIAPAAARLRALTSRRVAGHPAG